MSDKAQLFKNLEQLNIAYKHYVHDPVRTLADWAPAMQSLGITGGLVKNMFVQDKKAGDFLICSEGEGRTDLNLVGQLVGAKKLRFVSDESYLMDIFRVKPGSVTPLACCLESAKDVQVIIDTRLANFQEVNVHPMVNTESVTMAYDDLLKYLAHYNKTPIFFDSSAAAPPATKSAPKPKKEEAPKKDESGTKLGLSVPKSDFAAWYSELVVKAELIKYTEISGCYVLRPWSFYIWNTVKQFLQTRFEGLGVEEAAFPLFVKKSALEKEASHIEGFSAEVAWVTHSGTSALDEPIAVRPTSETIIYPHYADWIHSHRDLPLLINTWNNVVRWEFKQPTPFIRSREFLWQEGHTAHETDEEAWEFVLQILEFYAQCYQEMLAVPVIRGIKSENEKFAGGHKTSTVEIYIPAAGRGLQGATSHHLGQNFSKMFDITFEDKQQTKQFVHQTSWGFTTRSIGAMLMIHGDDKGAVLPPKVARYQVVLVPITFKDQSLDDMLVKLREIAAELTGLGIRCHVDDRTYYNPGWKFNHWELKGVPLRMECGPRDLQNQCVQLVRRMDGQKSHVSWSDLGQKIPEILEDIQKTMLENAQQTVNENLIQTRNWSEISPALQNKQIVLIPWCGSPESEELIKKRTAAELAEAEATDVTAGMKSLCIPLDQPSIEGEVCIITGEPAKCWAVFGRSY